MPLLNGTFEFLDFLSGIFFIKIFLLLFLIFYSVFALILYRQTQLMTRTLPIVLAPFIQFATIVQIGVALALFFVVLGTF
jgi:hypothetical protein